MSSNPTIMLRADKRSSIILRPIINKITMLAPSERAVIYTDGGGPRGLDGPAGAAGATGPQGAQGPQGPAGTLSIEPRTSDPASPAVGQIWLRTDL